jgi:hypothetical protein
MEFRSSLNPPPFTPFVALVMATIVPGHTDVDGSLYLMRIARLQSVAPRDIRVVTKEKCRPIVTRRNGDLGEMTGSLLMTPRQNTDPRSQVSSSHQGNARHWLRRLALLRQSTEHFSGLRSDFGCLNRFYIRSALDSGRTHHTQPHFDQSLST